MNVQGANGSIQPLGLRTEENDMSGVSQTERYSAATHSPDPAGATGDVAPEVVAEAMPDIAWVASPEGFTTYFNSHGTRYTGLGMEANFGWDWLGLIHPDDVSQAERMWSEAVQTKDEYVGEFRIRRFDGVYRWHRSHARPQFNSDGSVKVWFGTAIDIEDHKQAEQTLLHSQRSSAATLEVLRSIEAVAPIGFKLVDRHLNVLHINERLARVNGLTPSECVGSPVADIALQLWPQLESIYRRALDGETVANVEVSTPDLDRPGHVRHWLASYYPLRFDGKIVGAGNIVVSSSRVSSSHGRWPR